MSKKQLPLRARKPEDKSARRELILKQCFELFQRQELDSISMQALAQKSGLAKGTLYLYFQTKEEIFLECTRLSFQSWIERLEKKLQESNRRYSASQLSELLIETLKSESELARFLSHLHLILEKNISEKAASDFKLGLKAQLLQLSQLIENRTSALTNLDLAFSFLMKAYSLLVGLYQVCNPHPRIQKVLENPELSIFRMDFYQQLQEGLLFLLLGIEKTENKNTYHFFWNY